MYAKPREVYDLLQLSRDVYRKTLNDGDSVSGGDTIDLGNSVIIEDGILADKDSDVSSDRTIKLYVGGTLQDPADYTINLRKGEVDYNGTDSGTAEATYFYSDAQIYSSTVSQKIRSYTELIDNRTNTTFDGTKTVTDEIYSGTGYPEQLYTFDKLPVQSVSSVEVNDAQMDETDNWTSVDGGGGNEYFEIGKRGIQFIDNGLYPQHRRRALRVTYDYGRSDLPEEIKNLCLAYVGDDLLDFQVVSANVRGRDNFDPETTEILEMSKQEVIDQYRIASFSMADYEVDEFGSVS